MLRTWNRDLDSFAEDWDANMNYSKLLDSSTHRRRNRKWVGKGTRAFFKFFKAGDWPLAYASVIALPTM